MVWAEIMVEHRSQGGTQLIALYHDYSILEVLCWCSFCYFVYFFLLNIGTGVGLALYISQSAPGVSIRKKLSSSFAMKHKKYREKRLRKICRLYAVCYMSDGVLRLNNENSKRLLYFLSAPTHTHTKKRPKPALWYKCSNATFWIKGNHSLKTSVLLAGGKISIEFNMNQQSERPFKFNSKSLMFTEIICFKLLLVLLIYAIQNFSSYDVPMMWSFYITHFHYGEHHIGNVIIA